MRVRGELFKYGEKKLLSINLVYDLLCIFRREVHEGQMGRICGCEDEMLIFNRLF